METWKDIPGYEGHYQVSDLGNVRSVKSKIQLKLYRYYNDYLYCDLQKDGLKKKFKVHRLVLWSFIGHSGKHIDHINAKRDDNRLTNLRYCTARENSHYRHAKQKHLSKLRGVSFNGIRWRAKIFINKKQTHLGYFDSEHEAHQAYQSALRSIQ